MDRWVVFPLTVVAAIIIYVASPSEATEYHFRPVSFHSNNLATCTPNHVIMAPSFAPDNGMDCLPAVGEGVVVHNMTIPRTATSMNIRLMERVYSTDVAPTGNWCVQICAGVVLDGESRGALNLTACTLTATLATGNQLIEQTADFLTLVPRHTNGDPCAVTGGTPNNFATDDCRGGDLTVVTHTMPVGSCSGGSSNKLTHADLLVSIP